MSSLQQLIDLKEKADALPKIAGRAGLITAIRKKIKFIYNYKTDPQEEELLLDEAVKDYGRFMERLDNKQGEII